MIARALRRLERENRSFTSASVWGTPVEIEEPEVAPHTPVETTDVDYIYILSVNDPGAPTGGLDSEFHTPTGWLRDRPDPTATHGVWRSRRTRTFSVEGLRLPYGMPVGSTPGGMIRIVNQDQWEAYEWNPPQYMLPNLLLADPDASPKPTWAEIVEAAKLEERDELLASRQAALRSECKRRIWTGYGAESTEEEVFIRLSDEPVSAGHANRRTILDRYRDLRLWLDAAATLQQIAEFNPLDDEHWPVLE